MRAVPLVLFLLAASLEAQQGSAEGVVLDRSTGQPLRGVHVRMVTGDFGNSGISAVYGATSDAAGHFSAENMPPGLYLVLAERNGFVQLGASPTAPLAFGTLTLKAGQHVSGLKVEMTPRGLLAGRVVDEYGDPVDNVQVEAEPVPPGVKQESILGSSDGMTDDRGEFHIVTTPGKYYLHAMPRGGHANPEEIRTDGSSATQFADAFYPNAAGKAAAAVVQVAPGQDVAGLEIHLARSAASSPAAGRGFTISGVVTGVPESARANVTLQFGDSAEQVSGSRSTTAGPDGKFTFGGMQPGFYSALAIYSSGTTSLQSRVATFHLASDETGLQLALAPGDDLTGTLELLGDAAAGEPEKHTVRLEAAGGNPLGRMDTPAVQVGKDGQFRIANVFPGKFKAIVEPMPESGYVKEVTLDNKSAADEVLDLSQGAGGSRLKITVSRAGGRISGRILGKDGEPAMGLLMVLLAATPKEIDENNASRTSDGKYSFKGIRPGKYHLIALDMLEMIMASFAGGDEEEVMKSLFDAAEEVEIKEGDRISKDITAITKLPEKK
jgi:hypothetical protein